MIIIIPLGGKGERFKTQGYQLPKPLVRAFGKPIIEWILDSLHLQKHADIHSVIIPYNNELEDYRFEDLIKYKYPTINFLFLKMVKQTDGAAETIYNSLCKLSDVADMPIISLDGDNFYNTDIIEQWRCDNSVFVFEDNGSDPIYSYIEIEKERVINIMEKKKISNLACTGAYGFKSWVELKRECKYIIDNNIRQKNEYYVSTVISNMIQQDSYFTYNRINTNDYICLGTPLQLNMFILNNRFPDQSRNKRFCFDLDNTLVTYPVVPNDYSTCLPIQKNIEMLRYLKRLGNTIIIHTARRMRTHQSNLGRINADIGRLTFETLDKFEIPYDEIYFGKPDADFYIDDKGISCFNNLEREMGYYHCNKIMPRDFNKVVTMKLDMIHKEGKDLSGEIYYYLRIPEDKKYMFPKMTHYDNINYKWYDVEYVDGITVNSLFLLENLSEGLFTDILQSVEKLHSNVPPIENLDINMYDNYQRKLEKRYKEYDYSRFPDSDIFYDFLMLALNEYEMNQCGIKSMIHGDLVFTNILIDKRNQIKFIDMRGKMGDKLTIYGDRMYDYAKLYQSVIGYDEILQDRFIKNEVYKNVLLKLIEDKVRRQYGDNGVYYLKVITAMLLFTLIPLHNNDKCILYYGLISKILQLT